MGDDPAGNVIRTEQAAAALRDEFLFWQCRLRQLVVRQAGGKPSPGMRPRVLAPGGDEIATAVTVLILPRDPQPGTAQFRYQALKTQDPAERYDKALEMLAGDYFQRPREFSDVLTALFGPESPIVAQLLDLGICILEFAQYGQAYRVPCTVVQLGAEHPSHRATYWHNRLFNAALPPGIRILAFTPSWTRATGFKTD